MAAFYDPVARHIAIEKLVTRVGPEGMERKYYRIRPARWYGGIVTADCVGCGLLLSVLLGFRRRYEPPPRYWHILHT
ncbi:MAG: hypothetical protein QXU46_01915 [Candidatus Bathyarchaeia archaeon]